MSTIGSSKHMYFRLINSVHCQHPERGALLLNFIKVFAIDITEAYRWRLPHVQYNYSLQKKLADSSLLFNVLSILIKVGCSIPGGTVCRSCIATVQHNS